jgi:hypothetical protein
MDHTTAEEPAIDNRSYQQAVRERLARKLALRLANRIPTHKVQEMIVLQGKVRTLEEEILEGVIGE